MGVKVTVDELEDYAENEIKNGFKGKAIVAFIDLLGFKNEIETKWDDAENDPLKRLLTFKGYNEIAKQKAKFHNFQDYEGKSIAQIDYPEIITFSDSFIFIQRLKDETPDEILFSILSVCGSIFELWKVCIDGGFTIRGGIDYGEIYHNGRDLVGPSLIKTYEIESKIANSSRVVASENILKLIRDNLEASKPITKEYFKRFMLNDVDQLIVLNPIMLWGYNSPEDTEACVIKLQAMMDNAPSFKLKAKYMDLIARLRNQIDPDNNFEIFNAY